MNTLKKEEVGLNRLEQLENEHFEMFGCTGEAVFSASGRTELGGNHTDHNLGKVICGSINLDSLACVHETPDYRIVVNSRGFDPISIDISDLNVRDEERGTTAALIRGVAASIAERGGYLGGFSANMESLVTPGSGLSSSASVEVLFAKIFSALFNSDRFTTTELAQIGQEAENRYFGKPCGLMDQVGCANGGVVEIDFKDKKNPVINPVNIDFQKYGYSLVIVNSNSSHADLSEEYASIPGDMNLVARQFGKNYLREVDPEEFEREKSCLLKKVSERAVKRAQHYFGENGRVPMMTQALKDGNFERYLELVNASGRSSENFLCNILPTGVTENRLSMTLETAKMLLKGKGAYRVHGGGFAGTIQAYVPLEETDHFISHMNRYMGGDCCQCISIRELGVAQVL